MASTARLGVAVMTVLRLRSGVVIVASVAAVVGVLRGGHAQLGGLTRSRCFRAQHGRRHRTPDGEQGDQQDDEPEAQVLHGGEVSRGLRCKT